MNRIPIQPRSDWARTVESQGLIYHTTPEGLYWDESAYYHLDAAEIDAIEQATYELDRVCLEAVDHVITKDRLAELHIPKPFHNMIKRSWERDSLTIYGRFDLALGTGGRIKMLEFNADTPTGLLEAAAIQWFWVKERFPKAMQYNCIHERLIEAWGELPTGKTLHFTGLEDHPEDYMTLVYLRDTAMQAGHVTEFLDIRQLGWNASRFRFTDGAENPVEQCFKLYPWEWMFREDFGKFLDAGPCRWLEAPWKAVLSNKSILAILWELFPDHPNLLPASMKPMADPSTVRKPVFGREGQGIELKLSGKLLASTDSGLSGPHVYQQTCLLPRFGDHYACIGSWMVNGWAAGIGIREDTSPITSNLSRFVPHLYYPGNLS